MGEITGSELLGKAFWNEGIKDFFFLMGGPMLETEAACIKAGMRGIDVCHEQAAAMMAHAYSRVTQKPSLCIAASGPGKIGRAHV